MLRLRLSFAIRTLHFTIRSSRFVYLAESVDGGPLSVLDKRYRCGVRLDYTLGLGLE
jgi:hypothetical protein